MKCQDFGIKAGAKEGTNYIVVAGNPNVGKTALFNALTGLRSEISNFPGTTLDTCYGHLCNDIIIDTPGIYGVSSFTSEEKLARELILSADMVINVVDAGHLERDLFLTLHLVDLGIPMVVALNMVDEIASCGLEVKRGVLEQILGVPVVPTVAISGEGVANLIHRLPEASMGKSEPALQEKLEALAKDLSITKSQALLLLEGDSVTAEELHLPRGDKVIAMYKDRRHRVFKILPQVIGESSYKNSLVHRLGHMMLNPVTGIPILLIVLYLIYLLVGVIFAQTLVGITQGVIMEGYYETFIRRVLSGFIDPGSSPGRVLFGQFGLLTMSFTYMFGLLAPLVMGIFLVFAILEDSGYLPRIATLLDRLMSSIGLNGLAIIPLVLGFGCVTAALLTTRLLSSEREKRITMFLLALAVPCSAQMAFVAAVMTKLGFTYFLLYILFTFSAMVISGLFLSTFLPGDSTPLFLDMPRLRVPRLDNVLSKTFFRTAGFVKEAFPIFLAGTLLLGLLEVTGLIKAIENVLQPVTSGWLHLPVESSYAFITGFIRKELVIAVIMNISMTPLQQFVALVTLTLFVPCIASVMIIFKERGWKEGVVIWISVMCLAFLIGGLVARLLGLLVSVSVNLAPVLMMIIVLVLMAGILTYFHFRRKYA